MLFRERQLMSSFKLGDWVRNTVTNEVYQFNNVLKELQYTTKLYAYELWQPKPNEWVWSKGSYTQAFIFKWTSAHEQAGIINYPNYEPFIGQLPTFIKDQS